MSIKEQEIDLCNWSCKAIALTYYKIFVSMKICIFSFNKNKNGNQLQHESDTALPLSMINPQMERIAVLIQTPSINKGN